MYIYLCFSSCLSLIVVGIMCRSRPVGYVCRSMNVCSVMFAVLNVCEVGESANVSVCMLDVCVCGGDVLYVP
jgi:hypothetical protein